MICENCGNQLADDSKFCMSCGSKVDIKQAVQEAAASIESTATLESPAALENNITAEPIPAPVFVPPVEVAQIVQQPQIQPIQSQPVQPKPVQSQPIQPPQIQSLQVQTSQVQTAQPQQSAASQPVIVKKPASVAPLAVWKYIGMFILMSIPVLGLVMLFVWSFGSSFNRNTRNFGRASLIYLLIIIILTIAGYFTVWASLSDILSGFNLNM